MTSCASCLAWGLTYAGGVCLACYNFARPQLGHRLGPCGACQRRQRLKQGYCRLCWCQARHDRTVLATDARSAVILAPFLRIVRHHQLFLADLDRRRARPRTMPRRYGTKGRPFKPPPPPTAGPSTQWWLPPLFDDPLVHDYQHSRFDLRRHPAPDNPWLAWALHIAHNLAESRGWDPVVRRGMQRTLVFLLAGHSDGEVLRTSEIRQVTDRHSANLEYTAEILARQPGGQHATSSSPSAPSRPDNQTIKSYLHTRTKPRTTRQRSASPRGIT